MQLSDLHVLIKKFLSSTPKFNQQMPLHSCGPGEQALGISPLVQPVPPTRRWVGVPSLFLPCHRPWRCLLLLRWQARRGQMPELPRAQPPCFFHLPCQPHWCMSQAEPGAAGTASPGDALSRQGDSSWLSVFQQFLVSSVLWIISLLFPEISRQGELAGPRGAVTGQEGI